MKTIERRLSSRWQSALVLGLTALAFDGHADPAPLAHTTGGTASSYRGSKPMGKKGRTYCKSEQAPRKKRELSPLDQALANATTQEIPAVLQSDCLAQFGETGPISGGPVMGRTPPGQVRPLETGPISGGPVMGRTNPGQIRPSETGPISGGPVMGRTNGTAVLGRCEVRPIGNDGDRLIYTIGLGEGEESAKIIRPLRTSTQIQQNTRGFYVYSSDC